MALAIVLAFPLVLTVGFAAAWAWAADLRGQASLRLYLVLLAVPLLAVIGEPFTLQLVPPWTVAGLVLGVALWGVQGRTGERASWLSLLPLTAIAVAEEVIWRAFLVPRIGVVFASLAFAAHHYVFGVRHVAFTFVAGLAWAVLFVASGSLVPSLASHVVYNALVWFHHSATNSAPSAAKNPSPST